MNTIQSIFQVLRQQQRKAFVAFMTAGDPDLETTEKLVYAFEQAGVDIIELGVPFSDPMADGATIQASSQRALANGTTLAKILTMVHSIRKRSTIPLVLMTYYNPIFHFGEQQFIDAAAKAGVDGLIIPDLPPEEAKQLLAYAKVKQIAVTFFIAPTTLDKRIPVIAKATTGFIYYLSVTGVTGARTSLPRNIADKLNRIKSLTDNPVCVGFGISTPEQVKELSVHADGIIVGSAIVKKIAEHAADVHCVDHVARYVKRLVKALR